MKKFMICAILLFSAQSIIAAPLDRSIREIRDIVSSPELRRLLPSNQSILDIRRVDRGYLILTERYKLFVELLYGPRALSGEESGSAELQFNAPTELNK